jgi:Phage protein Gp138 N-terminal domain
MALSLADRLRPAIAQFTESIRQSNFDLRVCVPGIIQSFNATAMTAVVQVAVTETINTVDDNGNNVQQQVQIPLLPDVPVCIPRAGGFCLTLPIQAGDECLVIFADSHYGFFWQSGDVSSPGQLVRRHDLSDALCIPTGISQPKAQKLTNYSTTSAQLRSDDAKTIIDIQGAGSDGSGTPTVTITSQDLMANLSGNITLNVQGNVSATVQGDVDVRAQGNVEVTAQGSATVQAQSTATVEGENVEITGSSSVTIGNSSVTIDGTTTIQGIPFAAHTHQVTALGAPTGPPLP